ncbi:hypothetical protein [Capnocytophaga ochracea]|uniref:hypothetical protein n=1 Tax=Capnocytophaga ochracea TaxID=1018 RepID=UPI00223275B5|nr:hypothetical protein [Capnocytophaga ochracea]UZD36993.1 hypothetical protein OLG90_03690 [Capnocytophaga ochracea]
MFLRRYILLLLTLLSFTLQAQQYPVDVQVFVTPPYPQSLRGYADTFEQKIQAHFLLKDLSTGGRPFVLRFSLEDFQGQVIAQTPDYITPYLVNLSPGVRRTLTNIDFKTLLRYENLYGINEATYNGLLPEGTYFIGLSLYDVATGRPVSNKGRAMIQVRRYSPPVLTMPQKGEVLTKKNAFQHIVFQWMPRDVAPFMQYEFTLKEVWDLALVPEEAFMTGRLVYQTKTFSPALAYTNMMPILLENKRYVWQVRAFTNNPNNPNEQSYFKNNGNSETFYFDLVSHCEAPKFLTAITESTSAQLRWSAQAMMPNQEYPYKVMYREKGKTWKSQKVSMPYAKLTNLKRGRTYIYKVGVACGLETAHSSSVFGEESYMYSTEQEFTTTDQIDEKSQVQCGVKPEIRIKNTNPLQDNLYPNTTFTAGDFPVTVLNATGSNGVYSGEGYVKVPYLQDTKIKVVFNGIKLNTERQLIDGKLVTTYDETERNVQFIQEGIGEVFGDKGKKDQKMPFEVSEVQVDTLGRIIVIGKVDPKTGIAPKVTLPKGRDYVITDSKGKVYQLDESGKVTAEGTREEGTQLAQQAGKGESKNPPVNNKHFKVEWLFNDELANDTNGEIPYKALVKGKTSSFELRIQPADTTKYDFFFHTENGVKVEAESKGEGLYKITRKGAFDFAQEELWVVAKEKKDKKGKKEELIGKCILVHLSPKEVNVALVPTQSGQNLQAAIAQVQQIYEKVGVTLHITTEKPFDISDQLKNGTLPTENEFGDLSTYSPEQNAVIAKFTTNRKPKENTYYIFLVNDGTGDHGYMRLGGQYGFVYSTNARTIAHELGHGIFKLEHPFKGKNADKGKTTALMDYNEGQDFFYRDWKQINDPKVKLYAFQGQGEGEYLVYSLQQILDFLRSNKNKEVNFPPAKQDYNLEKYSSETRLDEYFTNKENKKVKIVGLYCNDKKGKLNLSTVGNIVGRTGYSVEFNEYNAVFSMYVYYAQGKEPAITIKTKGYHALKEILNYIGFEITGESKRYIAKLYKEAFGKAGYDYNKIDALLEDIPSFIISELSDETLWKYLQSLSKGSIDKAGTNEESAIFNVINSFKDDKYLYNQLYNHQEVVYDLYSGIDGDNVMRYLNKLLQLTDKYSKAEEQSLRHFCFLGLFKTGDYRFFTEIKNIKEHNRSKFIKSWKVTVLNKGIPSELDVSDLSNFSKENLLDVATVYLYKNSTTPKVDVLPIIYIYHLSKKQNQEDLLKTIEIASNFLGLYGASRGLFVKGASVILKTAATIEIVNLSLNAYMQNESHRKEIENMGAGGKWFVKNWSTISTLTDLATFSVAILDDLPKVSAKLQKEGVDTKELDTFVEKARKEVRKTITKGNKKILGKIVRNGNKVEYTNPAGKILRWSEQRAKDIENAIQATKKLNNTNVNNIGKITEGKVGEFVKRRKEVLGFGQKIEPNITDIDVSTLDEIIEVKTSFSAVKENQFDKFLNSKLDNFCNPEQKKVILYIDKPMSEATNTQLNMINRIKQKNVIVVNSLDELGKIIK